MNDRYPDPEAPEVLDAVLDRMRQMTREEWQAELEWEPENARSTWRTGDAMTVGDLTEANKALRLADLAQANRNRCNEVFHGIDEWTPTDWACAMAGECGECCNEIKKLRRLAPDFNPHDVTLTEPTLTLVRRAGFEIADMVIYADLLCQRLGLSLEDLIREKFNAVSERVGSDIRI